MIHKRWKLAKTYTIILVRVAKTPFVIVTSDLSLADTAANNFPSKGSSSAGKLQDEHCPFGQNEGNRKIYNIKVLEAFTEYKTL
ncbi:predicted protein [Chaetoceros tenuissimus]|uniref:Uncharacterized protein n=1 Tax=Chaetoceros tenuissimus TaxID=426638 RepID=A0AAD3D6V4_9STRA|nr:predicted protein [Chaetoceros tenuissimus]